MLLAILHAKLLKTHKNIFIPNFHLYHSILEPEVGILSIFNPSYSDGVYHIYYTIGIE